MKPEKVKEFINRLWIAKSEDALQKAEELIQELEAEMNTFFTKKLLREDIAHAFKLPHDFRAFLKINGGEGLCFGNSDAYIAPIDMMTSETKMWFEVDWHKQSEQEPWLYIGAYSDKHWYFICCDQTSDKFGQLVDCHDNTPWNDQEAFYHEGNVIWEFLMAMEQDFGTIKPTDN